MTQQDGVVRRWKLDDQYACVRDDTDMVVPNYFIVERWNRLVSLVQAQSEALERAERAIAELFADPGASSANEITLPQRHAALRAALSAIRAQLKEE